MIARDQAMLNRRSPGLKDQKKPPLSPHFSSLPSLPSPFFRLRASVPRYSPFTIRDANPGLRPGHLRCAFIVWFASVRNPRRGCPVYRPGRSQISSFIFRRRELRFASYDVVTAPPKNKQDFLPLLAIDRSPASGGYGSE
jgi:hypothetical protein